MGLVSARYAFDCDGCGCRRSGDFDYFPLVLGLNNVRHLALCETCARSILPLLSTPEEKAMASSPLLQQWRVRVREVKEPE